MAKENLQAQWKTIIGIKQGMFLKQISISGGFIRQVNAKYISQIGEGSTREEMLPSPMN